eukprot:gene28988-32179_t
MAMCMNPDQTTGDPSQYPTNPPDLTTLSCVLQESASQEGRAIAVKIVDLHDEDKLAFHTSDEIHLPVLYNLDKVQGGFSHLSLVAQPSFRAKFGIFPVINDPSDDLLLIIGVSRNSTEVDFTPGSKISALSPNQSQDLGCSAAVEPPRSSCDDPAWVASAVEDGIRWRPSPPIPEHHRGKAVPPGQSSHLSKAERGMSAPLPLLPSTTSVAKGVAHAECVHQDVQPFLIFGSCLSSPGTPISEKIASVPKVQPYAYDPSLDQSAVYLDRAHMRLEFTPMSEKIESVLQVQPYAYNPSLDQSAAYLDRAHMRLEFTPMPEKIESIGKLRPYAHDPSLGQSDIYLDRAYMRLSLIRARASSQQYRGSTTWYDTMFRSQQMSRRTDGGLPPDSGAIGRGSPSPSTAAGSARRRHEHSWYGTMLRTDRDRSPRPPGQGPGAACRGGLGQGIAATDVPLPPSLFPIAALTLSGSPAQHPPRVSYGPCGTKDGSSRKLGRAAVPQRINGGHEGHELVLCLEQDCDDQAAAREERGTHHRCQGTQPRESIFRAVSLAEHIYRTNYSIQSTPPCSPCMASLQALASLPVFESDIAWNAIGGAGSNEGGGGYTSGKGVILISHDLYLGLVSETTWNAIGEAG